MLAESRGFKCAYKLEHETPCRLKFEDLSVPTIWDIWQTTRIKLKLKHHNVKNHLWVFINCQIENPAFDSQTKEKMSLKISAFGSKCELAKKFYKKMSKTGIEDTIVFH